MESSSLGRLQISVMVKILVFYCSGTDGHTIRILHVKYIRGLMFIQNNGNVA